MRGETAIRYPQKGTLLPWRDGYPASSCVIPHAFQMPVIIFQRFQNTSEGSIDTAGISASTTTGGMLPDIIYHASPNLEDEERNGEELLKDDDCNVEDDVLRNILIERMYDAVSRLPEIEKEVITHLYLSDEPMTEHEFAKEFGIKRCTVHYYKTSALEKLREMLGENNSGSY